MQISHVIQRTLGISLTISFLGCSSIAQATSITFDDLHVEPTGILTVPNGYSGFQWSNIQIFNTINATPSGLVNGVVSSPNVAFNAYGGPANFGVSSGSFNFNSAYLTGAWRDGLNVEVQGFIGTTLTYDNTYTVNSSGPMLINFNYLGVTKVNFITSGGVQNPTFPYSGNGAQVAIDNITVSPVPEPASLALIGLGCLTSLRFFRRQQP